MSTESPGISLEHPKQFWAILWGGLSAGILDICAAFVNSGLRGRSPIFVLQSIASGFLGANSYKAGLPSAALGLAVHFFIAFTACTAFYLISRKVEFLVNQPIISGLLYGIAVYLFMYGIVLRVTFHRSFFQPASAVVIAVPIHMFCVGLPISLAVSRFSK